MDEDHDPVEAIEESISSRVRDHDVLRDSNEFRSEQVYLDRLTRDFALGLRAASFAFTRYPENSEWLLQSSFDDLLESAISVDLLGHQGVFNVGKRELRYMLEVVVKVVFCDQQVAGNTKLADRIGFINDPRQVPRSSVSVVDDLVFRMVIETQRFIEDVHSAFGSLSGYTHPSKTQLDERFRRAGRGEFSGLESVATLRSFNQKVAACYDLILSLVFEGIGPTTTGDVFIEVLDHEDRWSFRRSKYLRQVSDHFDYKSERNRPK